MASLLRHTECPACGHRHHFSLATDDLVLGREYVYLCPETAKQATLRPASPAEVVQTPAQGAVSLTPATYGSPPGHDSPADKAAGKPDPAPGLPEIKRDVHQMGREVQGLATRVGTLEEKVATTPPGFKAPSAPPTAGANEPETGPTRLQEVLPDVKKLAGKVGGLENLCDIVETLKETKE
jgi:hypothetical protein